MLCLRLRAHFRNNVLLFELFVTLLRVPYVQSGHVRGVFGGKI